ncbi:MAG: VanZ family protein [Terracidiphilus sp.]|jgi:VanZ family protein
MASSSIVYGIYQPQISVSEPDRLQRRLLAQMRTWLPVLACAMVFVIESTSYLGSDHTSAPLRRIAEALFGYGVDAQWAAIHHFIRKTGHFMGYGFFSLVCFRGFWIAFKSLASGTSRKLRAHGLAILATFLVASADEFHQSFLPNRYGSFNDVLLDTCGAVALCFVLFLVMQAIDWRKQMQQRSMSQREPAYFHLPPEGLAN